MDLSKCNNVSGELLCISKGRSQDEKTFQFLSKINHTRFYDNPTST